MIFYVCLFVLQYLSKCIYSTIWYIPNYKNEELWRNTKTQAPETFEKNIEGQVYQYKENFMYIEHIKLYFL